MKPLLLGECPSKPGDRYHHFPLFGTPAERLCRFAGIRTRVAVIPHPSGRNLLYNNPEMRELAGRILREAMA